MTASRTPTDARVPLPDGGTLSIRHYGDATGQPVLYFHGHPGSRLDPAIADPHNTVLTGLGVHLIAVDRPGYGRSTPQPHRRLLDWPQDVTALADHLDLVTFSVLGYSGGGPFALACAYVLPPARLRATAVVASMGPPHSPGQSRSPGWWLYSGSRQPLRSGIIAASATASRHLSTSVALRAARAGLPAPDRRALRDPSCGQNLIATWREAFRDGHSGAVDDVAIYTRPWGFDLTDVTAPVAVWHGTADRNVPPSVGRYLAAQLPQATAHFRRDQGHLSLFTDLAPILTALTE